VTRKIVVLRSTEDDHDMRHLQATLTSGGDVVIEGQDIGDSVEQIFGCWEYEWTWTIRAADVAAFLEAMETSGDVLSAMKKRFRGERAYELLSFLESHDVPHETWIRMGD
jgi:hypothetical protein